jgi:hypothetical protein
MKSRSRKSRRNSKKLKSSRKTRKSYKKRSFNSIRFRSGTTNSSIVPHIFTDIFKLITDKIDQDKNGNLNIIIDYSNQVGQNPPVLQKENVFLVTKVDSFNTNKVQQYIKQIFTKNSTVKNVFLIVISHPKIYTNKSIWKDHWSQGKQVFLSSNVRLVPHQPPNVFLDNELKHFFIKNDAENIFLQQTNDVFLQQTNDRIELLYKEDEKDSETLTKNERCVTYSKYRINVPPRQNENYENIHSMKSFDDEMMYRLAKHLEAEILTGDKFLKKRISKSKKLHPMTVRFNEEVLSVSDIFYENIERSRVLTPKKQNEEKLRFTIINESPFYVAKSLFNPNDETKIEGGRIKKLGNITSLLLYLNDDTMSDDAKYQLINEFKQIFNLKEPETLKEPNNPIEYFIENYGEQAKNINLPLTAKDEYDNLLLHLRSEDDRIVKYFSIKNFVNIHNLQGPEIYEAINTDTEPLAFFVEHYKEKASELMFKNYSKDYDNLKYELTNSTTSHLMKFMRIIEFVTKNNLNEKNDIIIENYFDTNPKDFFQTYFDEKAKSLLCLLSSGCSPPTAGSSTD